MAKTPRTPRAAVKTEVRNSPIPKVAAAKAAPKVVTPDAIARRAYEIWQSSGGSELDNWLRAERELRGS